MGWAIKDVSERTGLSAATIRMWERRYGFPAPARTASGYREYSDADVEALRRVVALRADGLSLPAAMQRAGEARPVTDRPSLYGAIVAEGTPVAARRLTRATLKAISHAIEDETIARGAGPVVFGAFQRERHYRAVEHRYRRIAGVADACVAFADFAEPAGGDGEPLLVPVHADDAVANEWAVVVDAPGYACCLLAWETPESQPAGEQPQRDRSFEALWTLDPQTVRRAALAGATIAGGALGERLDGLLRDRPLALESPAPGLTALTNRIVGYVNDAR